MDLKQQSKSRKPLFLSSTADITGSGDVLSRWSKGAVNVCESSTRISSCRDTETEGTYKDF